MPPFLPLVVAKRIMGNILVSCLRLTKRKTTPKSPGTTSRTAAVDLRLQSNSGLVNKGATVTYPAYFNQNKLRCSTSSVSQRFPADSTRRRSSSCSIVQPDRRKIVQVYYILQWSTPLHGHTGGILMSELAS